MSGVVEEVAIRATLKDEVSKGMRGIRQEAEKTAETLNKVPPRDAQGRFVKYQQGVDGAAKSVDGLGKSLQSTDRWLTQSSQTLDRWAGRGAIGLTAAAAAATGFGLKANASFELSRTAFGALLGDTEKGNALFAQLQQYNLATPFNLPQVAAAEQTLLQFNAAGTDSMGILKSLGDIASLTSDPSTNLERMALAIGQIKSAGVLRAQDLNQLVQAGFPAYQLLADITGKTAAQIRQEMDSGLSIPADQFIAATEKMQGSLSRFEGGAAKANATLTGQWSNFVDTLRMQLADATGPLATELEKDLPGLSTMVGDFAHEVMPPLVDVVKQMLEEAQQMGPGFGQSIAGALHTIAPQVPAILHLLGSMVQVLPQVVSLLGEMATMASPITTLVGDLLGFAPLQPIFGGLLTTLLGYRILRAVGLDIRAMAGGLRDLAAAEVAEGEARTVAGGVGGIKGRGRALGTLGLLGASLGVSQSGIGDSSPGGILSSTVGLGITGATIGSVVPGAGTLVGGLLGGAAGLGLSAGTALFGGHDSPAAVTSSSHSTRVNVTNNNQVTVSSPQEAREVLDPQAARTLQDYTGQAWERR